MSIAITSLHECRAVLIPRILSHTVHRAAHFDPPVRAPLQATTLRCNLLAGEAKSHRTRVRGVKPFGTLLLAKLYYNSVGS